MLDERFLMFTLLIVTTNPIPFLVVETIKHRVGLRLQVARQKPDYNTIRKR